MVTGHNVADIVVILKTLPTGRLSSSVITQILTTLKSMIVLLWGFFSLLLTVEAVQALGNKLLEELKQSDPGEGKRISFFGGWGMSKVV